jgi:hypothetical protein
MAIVAIAFFRGGVSKKEVTTPIIVAFFSGGVAKKKNAMAPSSMVVLQRRRR